MKHITSRKILRPDFYFLFLLLVLFFSWTQINLLTASNLVPVNDFAANDLLISSAKSFKLLHGNYSRVGFYHPGPFFLQLMAFSELLFHDTLRLIKSPISAQLLGSLIFYSFAIAILYNNLIGYFNARLKSLTAILLTLAITCLMMDTHQYYLGALFFVVPWFPFLYIGASFFVLAGLIGIYSQNRNGLPVLVLGLMMLVHGHACFIALVPLMCLLIAAFFWLQQPSLSAFKDSIITFSKENNHQVMIAILIVVLFMLPIGLNTWINWPGEIPKYFSFAHHKASLPAREILVYLGHFLYWPLLIIPVFFLSAVRDKTSDDTLKTLVQLPLLVLFITIPCSLFFAFRGLDTLVYKYPLFWATSMVAFASAISYISILEKIKNSTYKSILLIFLSSCSLFSLSQYSFHAIPLGDEAKAFNNAVNIIQSITPKGSYTWIKIKPQLSPIVFATTLASIDKRTERQTFCFVAENWDPAYSEKYKCDAAKNPLANLIQLQLAEKYQGPVIFSIKDVIGMRLPLQADIEHVNDLTPLHHIITHNS